MSDIQSDIQNHKIVLYMKGTPDMPQCGFSSYVCAVLKHFNVSFLARNVLEDPALREDIKTFSNWPTLPQLYIDSQFVGGCDIVKSMYENGTLKTLLQEKGCLTEPRSKEVLE